jgi:hypothetical protein
MNKIRCIDEVFNVGRRPFNTDYESKGLKIVVKINSILNSDNACYHSVQKLFSSRMFSSSIKIECEPWSLTLREEQRFKVPENRALKRGSDRTLEVTA